MTARRVVLAVGIVVLLWVAVAGLLMARVADHVRAGQRAVTAAQAQMKASTITDSRSPDLLPPVISEFGAARRELGNPLLAPARHLPLIGRQLRTVETLAGAAEQVGRIGETAVQQARAAVRAPHSTGPERVTEASALASAATTADTGLAGVSLGSDRALIGAVRSRYDDFATRLAKLRVGLHRGAVAAQATARLLRGPSHILLLAANNAEMRNGSGMFLSAAEVDIDGGALTLGPVHPAVDLELPEGAVAPSGSYATVWAAFEANRDIRNLGVTPRFETTAPLAAAMWKAVTGQQVDGVMSLDVAGLQALLGATGPLVVGSVRLDASSAVTYLLHDQYVGLNGESADARTRHEELGQIARATLAAVEAGGYDAGHLAGALPAVVAGRHLMMWSDQPDLEADWATAGAAGTLKADALLAAVQNMGANKLDPYLSVSSDVAIQPGPVSTTVTVTMHLANSVPPGQPAYIAGDGAGGEPPYTYRAYVTLTLPASADRVSVDGQATAQASGIDGLLATVAVLRDVPAGHRLDVVFTFSLPVAHGHLQVESAGRLPAATVHLVGGGAPVPDDRRPRVVW